MKNMGFSSATLRHTARQNLVAGRLVACRGSALSSSVLGILTGVFLIAGATACGSSSNNKDGAPVDGKDAGAGGHGGGGLGGVGDGLGGGAGLGGAGGDDIGGAGGGLGGTSAGGAGGFAGVAGGGGLGLGGLGGLAGLGGMDAVAGMGGSSTGGAAAITCATHVMLANAAFTNFEYLDTSPTLSFTTPDGFNGKFFGDDNVNSMNFVVASAADAHSATHALSVSSPTTGFVEMGLDFNSAMGCLDLSAFTGITFWAKGVGKLGLKVTDGSGDYSFTAPLSATYAQYTVTWAQLGMFSPPVINKMRNFLFTDDGTIGSPTSLFIDDIAFVP